MKVEKSKYWYDYEGYTYNLQWECSVAVHAGPLYSHAWIMRVFNANGIFIISFSEYLNKFQCQEIIFVLLGFNLRNQILAGKCIYSNYPAAWLTRGRMFGFLYNNHIIFSTFVEQTSLTFYIGPLDICDRGSSQVGKDIFNLSNISFIPSASFHFECF